MMDRRLISSELQQHISFSSSSVKKKKDQLEWTTAFTINFGIMNFTSADVGILGIVEIGAHYLAS